MKTFVIIYVLDSLEFCVLPKYLLTSFSYLIIPTEEKRAGKQLLHVTTISTARSCNSSI